MNGTITPSQYLKAARQDFKNLPADACDELLDMMDSNSGWHELFIPDYIPQKYHARMQKTWTLMVFLILTRNATRKYSLVRRHNMLKNALIFRDALTTAER